MGAREFFRCIIKTKTHDYSACASNPNNDEAVREENKEIYKNAHEFIGFGYIIPTMGERKYYDFFKPKPYEKEKSI